MLEFDHNGLAGRSRVNNSKSKVYFIQEYSNFLKHILDSIIADNWDSGLNTMPLGIDEERTGAISFG